RNRFETWRGDQMGDSRCDGGGQDGYLQQAHDKASSARTGDGQRAIGSGCSSVGEVAALVVPHRRRGGVVRRGDQRGRHGDEDGGRVGRVGRVGCPRHRGGGRG